MVDGLVKCPRCGQEVEYFLKRKPRDGFLKCPSCNQLFIKSELINSGVPIGAKIKVKFEDTGREKVMVLAPTQPLPKKEEEGEKEEGERLQAQAQGPQSQQPQPQKRQPPVLFEPPKEPEQIVAEILTQWGCDESFVRLVCDYIRTKGFFDPGWLMGLLTSAKTGRRFTQQEAFMVVDMIVSALEQEKRKAEETGRFFRLTIVPLGPTTSPTPQPVFTSYTSYTPYYPASFPSQYSTTQHPPYVTPPQPPTVPAPSTTQYPPAQPVQTMTPQQIQEMIRQALAEQKRQSDIEELKKMILELEKKRIEDKAEMEKQRAQDREEILKTVREILSNIQPPQSSTPSTPPDVVTKKDLELLKSEMEKALLKKEFESKIESLSKEVESLKSVVGKPVVSPEGWQKDETRLIAELGTRTLDILDKRKPLEVLVRLVQQPSQPPQQEQKTEKSLVDLIKESGGIVE
jgi:uncharacterized C2H2 Zn-finger protein